MKRKERHEQQNYFGTTYYVLLVLTQTDRFETEKLSKFWKACAYGA